MLRIEEVLENAPETQVTLNVLARMANLERTYCSRIVRELIGTTFRDWIRSVRIEKARALLVLSEATITEVSFAVGYRDLTTFERNFRKHSGMSPRDFRQKMCGLPQ
jgi:two-component system response regulator YesN